MPSSTDQRLARIRRSRPFADRLDPDRIEPIHREFAHSGSAFWATGRDGVRYKLRVSPHRLRAVRIANYVRMLPELFAPLIARQGRFLLLGVLQEHRPMTRTELVRRAIKLGRLAAVLHVRSAPQGRSERLLRRMAATRIRWSFLRDLALLERRGALSSAEVAGARRKFEARRREGLVAAVELDDLHKGNFMIRESDGEIRYVDEDAVSLQLRGMGMASLLKTATKSRMWNQYLVGYGEVADPDWFSAEYTELLLLVDGIRAVAHKLRTGERIEKLPAEAEAVRLMAGSDRVELAWRFPRG